MADNGHKGDDGHAKGDDGHGGDHGDHGGGGDKPAKASGGGGGGNWATKLLRNPVAWAVAGVGALLAVVFAGGVTLPTVDTGPSTYDVSDSQDATGGSSPGARRAAGGSRIGSRTCGRIVERARAEYGRDWERELSRKERADCGRAIQEARRADRSMPQQAEGPRGPAPGAGDVEVQRLSVAYGDLDLNTSAGAQRFLQRLESAAVRVCGGRPDIRDLEARRAFKECVQRNMDRAVAQLRSPRVTQLHQRSG
jgi:UrcA family protein